MVLTSFAFLLHRNWSASAGDCMQCMGWSSAAGGLMSKMMLLLMQLCVLVGSRLEKDAEQQSSFCGHKTALRSAEEPWVLCKS